MSRKTRRQTRSSEVPADILVTLPSLRIDVEKINSNEAWALCPGPHAKRTGKEDRKASWSINLDTGEHHCFSCGWGGDYAYLVAWVKGWNEDDDRIHEWIRKYGGVHAVGSRLRGDARFIKEQAEPVTEADLALFTDPPRWAREERDVSLVSCQAFGVLWMPSTDRWIFPIRDPFDGHLMGWQEKGKGVFQNYPEHVEKSHTLFGYDLIVGDTAYLYESPIEPVRAHTYQLDGPVSSWGVHVSDFQMGLLSDRVDTLYLCLDNDGAGRSKTRRIWTDHRRTFRRMFIANYDGLEGKDHGEMQIDDVQWSLDYAIPAVRYRPDVD